MKLIKDPSKLKTKIEPSSFTQQEVDTISDKLKKELEKHGGLGLSANQIGLTDRVCLINVKEPLLLVNPKVVEVSKETVVYVEQCLSLDKTMKKPVQTIRHKSFTVECDNLGTVLFSSDKKEGETWKDSEEFYADEGLLECVCAQHEIDHLNGILITDSSRRYTQTVTREKKYGRNERVMVKLPSGDTEFMKYKKAEPLLTLGAEIL
jgi:peptide deformylase